MKLLSLVGFLLFSSSLLAHPLHKSVVNIDFTSPSQFQVVIQLIDHDLEEYLQIKFGENQPQNLLSKGLESKSFWIEFFKKQCYLSIGQSQHYFSNLTDIRHENGEWFFVFQEDMEVTPQKIKLHNQLLTSHFSNQKNLVFLNYQGEVQQKMFNNDRFEHTFVVDKMPAETKRP